MFQKIQQAGQFVNSTIEKTSITYIAGVASGTAGIAGIHCHFAWHLIRTQARFVVRENRIFARTDARPNLLTLSVSAVFNALRLLQSSSWRRLETNHDDSIRRRMPPFLLNGGRTRWTKSSYGGCGICKSWKKTMSGISYPEQRNRVGVEPPDKKTCLMRSLRTGTASVRLNRQMFPIGHYPADGGRSTGKPYKLWRPIMPARQQEPNRKLWRLLRLMRQNLRT